MKGGRAVYFSVPVPFRFLGLLPIKDTWIFKWMLFVIEDIGIKIIYCVCVNVRRVVPLPTVSRLFFNFGFIKKFLFFLSFQSR